MTCTDYFGRKSWQWEDETQRIRYAISRMDGKELALFGLTYRRQMTGEIGYTRKEGYEFWHVFAEQALRHFGPTHGAEKSLQEMGSVRTVTRAEEHFKERKYLRGGGPSSTTRGEKRKFQDSRPTVTAKRVKRHYTAKEKADYEKKKAGERKVKKEGLVAPAGEVRNKVWAETHQGVDEKLVDKRQSDNECTRCGMKNKTWK